MGLINDMDDAIKEEQRKKREQEQKDAEEKAQQEADEAARKEAAEHKNLPL